MARQGRGASALATAAIGSFIAGTIATVALTFLAPVMVEIALQFGAAGYFALMVLAFTTVSALLGSSIFRGLASLFLGEIRRAACRERVGQYVWIWVAAVSFK